MRQRVHGNLGEHAAPGRIHDGHASAPLAHDEQPFPRRGDGQAHGVLVASVVLGPAVPRVENQVVRRPRHVARLAEVDLRGNGQLRLVERGRLPLPSGSGAHRARVIAAGSVAGLALHAVLDAKRRIPPARPFLGGGRVATEAELALARRRARSSDVRDAGSFGTEERPVRLRVPRSALGRADVRRAVGVVARDAHLPADESRRLEAAPGRERRDEQQEERGHFPAHGVLPGAASGTPTERGGRCSANT